jgi:hypothetical protein
MTVYKLMKQRKDGTLGPLFINSSQCIPLGSWLKAESHQTKGFAYRPGFHCTLTPKSHIMEKPGRVWVRVRVKNYKLINKPNSTDQWVLAQQMIVDEVL